MTVVPTPECPNDDALRQFSVGQMADAEPLEQHLRSCAACVARLDVLPTADPLLETVRECGRTGESAPDPDALTQLIQRLRQTVSSDAARSATRSWPAVSGTPTPGQLDTPGGAIGDALPARTGRYRLLRRIGAGGMGAVYLAEDPELSRTVALKLPRFAGDAESQALACQRFLREARAAAAVRHAHVCPIHDVGEQDGTPFVVMAYIEGCSLAERLRDGAFLDTRMVVTLAAQIAEGLAAVHDKGVIHRDLKPGNVLLDQAGDAYLTDFGLARWQDDAEHLTADGVLVGTPAYMAPEQIAEEFGPVTPRSDVYSLGVVLYQMLTGRLPFTSHELVRLSHQIVHDHPPPPRQLRADLDARLEAIVLRAMARRPEDRFADARQLTAALRDWLNAPPTATVVTVPPPLPPLPREETADEMDRRPRPRRRWSWRAAGMLMMVVSLGSVVGYGVLHLRPDHTLPGSRNREQVREQWQPEASRVAFRGEIDVRVWKKGNLAGPGRLLGAVVLPLNLNDEVRVEAKVNRPAYLYVVWLDTAGKPLPIYPWGSRWQWPVNEEPVDRLSLPTNPGNKWPISGGESGMETLLLLVRATPWPREVDLRKLLTDLPRPAMQDPASAVWFRDWEVVHDETDRGPNLFDERRPDDPVLRTQEILRERLRTYCDFSRAVSFANAGK